MTYTCCLPAGEPAIGATRSLKNAIHIPSGDHAAAVDDLAAVVSRCRSLPSAAAIHRSVSNAFASQFVRVSSYTTRLPSGEIAGAATVRISSD